MNDSTFAVAVFIGCMILVAASASIAAVVAMSGPRECSVTLEYAGGHKVEYITKCDVG